MIPKYIQKIRDVSDEKAYSLAEMSSLNWRMPEKDRQIYHRKRKQASKKHLKQD